MSDQNNKQIDLSQLSAKELKQELKRREHAELEEKEKAIKLHLHTKDTYIADTVAEFERLQEMLIRVKQMAIANGNKLYKEMFAVYDKKPKKVKQFSLMNRDKTMKIVVDNAEVFGFSDEAEVAIEAIKEFFKDKFAGRSKLVYNLLDTLLIKNGKGDYDPKLLTKLRAQVNEINDQNLTEAYELLEASQIVTGTALYLRAYKKDKNGKMKDIVLQFSAL